MRYVTVRTEREETSYGTKIKVYKKHIPDILDVLFFTLGSLAVCAILFFVGVYVGADEATEQIKPTAETEVTEEVTEEYTDYFSEVIPLSYTEQQDLYNAAEEFGVDYYTMLGLIEKETNFRNVYGDGGKAYGYCQVWLKWWKGKMQNIGAHDLNTPKDNFRTACAIMAELTDRYESTAGALTAYNKGSFNGTVTEYATAVLANAEKWRGI